MNSLNINSTITNNLMIVKIVLIFSLLELGFSQPELKVHLNSFSVHCQHLTFHILIFFGTIWTISTKLGTEHPLVRGIIYLITWTA